MTTQKRLRTRPTHVTFAAAARELGMHPLTVKSRVADGELEQEEVTDPTGRVFKAITRRSLDRLLAKQRAEAASAA